jgi:hypothetical protein
MEQDYDRSFTFFFSPAFIICWLAIVILQIAAMWKVFTKAGQPGWAANYSYLQFVHHDKDWR